jgi:iron(III) transport system ATP-binding protein
MELSLKTENLTKHFDDVCAVENITLNVKSGEFLTILGPSGCGKTTALRLLAGFETPTSGMIKIGDTVVADDTHFIRPENRKVGMVFQDYALFPHVNVADNVAFGLRGRNKDKEQQTKRMLSMVGLSEFGHRMPYELSGGQQQRVALARALAPNPDILLLDEPFSNLDTALRAQVRADVRKILRETETTAIFVTHDQEEALSLSDEIAVIFNGQLAQVATPHLIYNRPINQQVAQFIGEANFLPAQAHGMIADSPLGSVNLFHEKTGDVQLMIRPEALSIDVEEDSTPATVLWREFYGHTQRVGIALEDGTQLVARIDVDVYYKRGQNVCVSLGFPALAFDIEHTALTAENQT